jgi:hypothetical protein
MNVDNSPFEMTELFQFGGTILVSENYRQEDIKGRLKSGTAC